MSGHSYRLSPEAGRALNRLMSALYLCHPPCPMVCRIWAQAHAELYLPRVLALSLGTCKTKNTIVRGPPEPRASHLYQGCNPCHEIHMWIHIWIHMHSTPFHTAFGKSTSIPHNPFHMWKSWILWILPRWLIVRRGSKIVTMVTI